MGRYADTHFVMVEDCTLQSSGQVRRPGLAGHLTSNERPASEITGHCASTSHGSIQWWIGIFTFGPGAVETAQAQRIVNARF